MKYIKDIEELKTIQMGILSYLDKFCRENNIKYSISGGTLIGAVRHGGYIPWDDDIDILLRREDYDKMVSLFSKKDTSFYRIYTHELIQDYNQPYAKIADTRTIIEEPGQHIGMGVNIDIFPFDHITENVEEQKKVLKEIMSVRNKFVIKGLEWRRGRSLFKNLFVIFSRVILAPISRKSLARKIDYISRHAGPENSRLRACLVWGYGAKEIIDSRVFDEYADIPFENTHYMALKDYDTYLRHLFGDYMQLPPEDKRVTHHEFIAWWK